MKDLNVRPETIECLEENIGSMLFDIGLCNIVLGIFSGKRNKNKQVKDIKLKSICTIKEAINKMKRQPIECENIFANNISQKGLIFKLYKNSYKSTSKT